MLNRRAVLTLPWAMVAAGWPIPIPSSESELAATLRSLALQHMPTPLYAQEKDWGRTKLIPVPRIRNGQFKTVRVPKNDGHWRKIHVEALNPRDTLVVDVRDVVRPAAGVMNFTLHAAMDVRFNVTQEHWENGLKLYGTSVRARARIQATMKCTVETQAELKDFIPEFALIVKVTEAKTSYDNLVVEHIAGIGGDGAKLLGGAAHDMIQQWKPSWERALLDKANAAILKAAGHKEYRVSLDRLWKSKTDAKKP
jgi:hypothetical protein